MADFEAPSGPPPPRVPEGWVARWNAQYQEWFYVNTYTKKSQWEKPTEPARPPMDDGAPPGPPPAYPYQAGGPAPTDSKTNPFTPHSTGSGPSSSSVDRDAELARKLQEEEDARARGSGSGSGGGGAAASYLNSNTSPVPSQSTSPLPAREGESKSRGLLGKIFGGSSSKNKYGSSSSYGGYGGGGGYAHQGGHYHSQPQQGYYPPQQGYGGGYPPQQGGYYPQQQGYGGGYGGYAQQRPGRSGGGGMGMAGEVLPTQHLDVQDPATADAHGLARVSPVVTPALTLSSAVRSSSFSVCPAPEMTGITSTRSGAKATVGQCTSTR
ncbi:hypothetical protein VMCG_04328 [Cytospora schulzeri]|uniref:WW domain-containing protein n=1 Tax=Cytospora schulzeri TaxID=448051 RepID=A0A423WSJ4_9PEZI|nr:hypothetical protein VMCG_04328 [Valsa malicola]